MAAAAMKGFTRTVFGSLTNLSAPRRLVTLLPMTNGCCALTNIIREPVFIQA